MPYYLYETTVILKDPYHIEAIKNSKTKVDDCMHLVQYNCFSPNNLEQYGMLFSNLVTQKKIKKVFKAVVDNSQFKTFRYFTSEQDAIDTSATLNQIWAANKDYQTTLNTVNSFAIQDTITMVSDEDFAKAPGTLIP